MVALDDETIVTGAAGGIIRLMTIPVYIAAPEWQFSQ
jgi:hypothetical protein